MHIMQPIQILPHFGTPSFPKNIGQEEQQLFIPIKKQLV